jgi:predicted lipoprotein with Yx(FWY)xxD motif
VVDRFIRTAMLVGGAAAVLALPACGVLTTQPRSSGQVSPAAANQDLSAEQDSGATGYGADAGAAASASPSGSGSASSAPPAPAEPAEPVTAPNSLIAKTIPKMGQVVTDDKGWTLYRFDKDRGGAKPESHCVGTCAEVWPPALTNGHPKLVGIDPELVGTIRRPDGTLQLTLHGWALYRYIGDPKTGAWKGQGVAGTWWVSAQDGSKNLTCVPKGTPKAVTPPSAGSGNY